VQLVVVVEDRGAVKETDAPDRPAQHEVVVRRDRECRGEREERIATVAPAQVEGLAVPAPGSRVVGLAGQRVALVGLGRNVVAIAARQLIDVARVSGDVTERLGVREREG